MTGASKLVAGQDGVYGCVILGGVFAFAGFDCNVTLSFKKCFVFGSAKFSLCVEVEHIASAPGRICLVREWAGWSRALSMESYLEACPQLGRRVCLEGPPSLAPS